MIGAAKDKQDTRRPGDARDLAEVVLRDAEGRDARLGDMWRERPAAVVWLRHYG